MKRRLSVLLCGLCCLAALSLFQAASVVNGQSRSSAGEYIQGTVVGVGGRLGGRTRPFELIINRYTSPEEVQQLNAALQSGGQDELLRVLSKMSAGRIIIGNGVGITANAIISTPQENGRKLIVLYQRNVSFYELRYGTRSEDYKFGYAEIFLGRGGRREGTFIPAAKVRLRDGNTWEVEDFGEFPARLLGLRVRGSGRVAR